jgi:hypothetical protein
LLSFGAEFFVFQLAIQKYRDEKRQKCTLLLPVAWYRCESWSLMLREEHRLRMFENGVLRRIFRHKGWGNRGVSFMVFTKE